MLGFLFVADDAFEVDPGEAAKAFTADGLDVIRTARTSLADLASWSTQAIETALRASLIDGMGLKPRKAFGPVRVAVTGKKISPPLFESLELLGRDKALARLDAALAA